MYISHIGCAYAEKTVYPQQARLDRACLLAAYQHIDRLLALPVMVGREIYQYKHYHLAKFEWEDIVRYSVVILLGSIINYLILDSLL